MTKNWRRSPAIDVVIAVALAGLGAPVALAEPADQRVEVAASAKNADDKDKPKKPKAPRNQGGADGGDGSGDASTPNASKGTGAARDGDASVEVKKAGSAKGQARDGKAKGSGSGQGQLQGYGKPAKPRNDDKRTGSRDDRPPSGQLRTSKGGNKKPADAAKLKAPTKGSGYANTPAPRNTAPLNTGGSGYTNTPPPRTVAPANTRGSGYANVPWKRPDPVVVKRTYKAPPKPVVRFDDVKRDRKVETVKNVRLYREPDRRVIIKQDNRVFINHDESDRFRRISRSARTARRSDGYNETIIVRDGGVRIINVVDDDGYLVYRARRDRYGRETIIIDNRRHRERSFSGRDVALGVGAGLVLGAALVALAPPVHAVPPDKYVVDYGRASDEDVYEALTAPPVERLDRDYSLDEIRYSEPLRERMRRVDLDTVTFDFGSWEVGEGEYGALEKIAGGIQRALDHNADEVFLIEGHTDAVGDEDDNLSLSDRRAQSVAEILTAEFGVPPENLVTQGYGEQFLKIPTDGPERANRRIVVRRISPLMSEKFRN